MMEETMLHTIHDKLKEKFGEEIMEAQMSYDFPVFTVKKDKIVEIIQYLKEDPEMGFQYLTDLCGIHFPNAKDHELGVVYHLHNLPKNKRIRLKLYTSIHDPSVPTLTSLFSAANWMERETFDFFGIVFKGHPNLKRILNVEDMNYFPLRKEFPLEDATREDKDDTMFGRG